MTRKLFGALTVGTRKTVDACSSAFAKITGADETVARKLATPGLPPQFASGVAVLLLVGDHAFHAATGGARCYRERAGVLEALAPGAIELSPGDTVIAASHADLPTGAAFVGPVGDPGGDDTFRNDGLDAALNAALARHPSLLSAAAAHVLA